MYGEGRWEALRGFTHTKQKVTQNVKTKNSQGGKILHIRQIIIMIMTLKLFQMSYKKYCVVF